MSQRRANYIEFSRSRHREELPADESEAESGGLLDRFLDRMKTDLAQLTDYACTESTERLTRPAAEQSWQKVDTLRSDVAVVKDRELYALPGGRFQGRPLAMMVGRGTVGTGQFGRFARHVFLAPEGLRYRGSTELDGRHLGSYDYDLSHELQQLSVAHWRCRSRCRLSRHVLGRSETLDLVRPEVKPYEMPDKLGLAQTETALEYARRINAELSDIRWYAPIRAAARQPYSHS